MHAMRKMTAKGFLKSEFLMNLETLKDGIRRKLESFNKTKKEEDGVCFLSMTVIITQKVLFYSL